MRISCVSLIIYVFAYLLPMTSNLVLLSEVKRGRQRKYALKHTQEKPLMVSEIMKAINEDVRKTSDGKEIRLRDISRALKWLANKKLVKCLNPTNQRGVKGILYQLTPKGKKIQKHF